MSSTQMTSKITGADGGNAQPNISLVPAQNTLGENVAFTCFFFVCVAIVSCSPSKHTHKAFSALEAAVTET